jgi:hypothetical protein
LPWEVTFDIRPFQGKNDLLNKLEARLSGYAAWLPSDWRIVVVVDRDDDDCLQLKQRLESIAQRAGLRTRTSSGGAPWQLVNRIAIEELEAWYFGDWEAVRAAYPRVSANIPQKRRFRDPDMIAGGTWEAFEKVLQNHGYFPGGFLKIEAARTIGARIEPARNSSRSFQKFRDALSEASA